jgi:hypothetical protein
MGNPPPLLEMSLAASLALSMASSQSKTPSSNSSVRTVIGPARPDSGASRISVYKGKSERPLGWKPKRTSKQISVDSITKQIDMKKWDGGARTAKVWDGLRKVCCDQTFSNSILTLYRIQNYTCPLQIVWSTCMNMDSRREAQHSKFLWQ